MPVKKIAIWNQRMLTLMDYCINNKIKGLEYKQDFLKMIKINAGSALKPIQEGRQSFTHENFKAACDQFGVSMDWFYGYSDKMKRVNKRETVEELLQQALIKLKAIK